VYLYCIIAGEVEDNIFTTIASLATELTLAQLLQDDHPSEENGDDDFTAENLPNVSAAGMPGDSSTENPQDVSATDMPEGDQSDAKLPSSVDQSGSEMPALDQSGIAGQEVETTGRPEDSVSEGMVDEKEAEREATTEVLQEANLSRNATRNRLLFHFTVLQTSRALYLFCIHEVPQANLHFCQFLKLQFHRK
jgi:hypothetical protein